MNLLVKIQILLISFIVISSVSFGQHTITRSVIGNGNFLLSDQNNSINSLFGQTIIEKSESSDYSALFGFWNSHSITVGVDENDLVPDKFELFQNYPNPFNPTTKIKFSIPETSHVLLEVFNILGERVSVLVNGEKTPGYYTLEFNAKNYSSGFYIYRLNSKDYSEVKKMILLK
jgi:hypothetical protein